MAINFGLAQPQGNGYLDTLQAFALGRESKLQQQKQVGRQQAAEQLGTGDIGAARTTAIQTGNFDMAQSIGQLSDDHQKQLAAEADTMGYVAQSLKQLPPTQWGAAIASYAPALKQRGFSDEEIAAAQQQLSGPQAAEVLDGYIASSAEIQKALAAANKPTDAQRNLISAGILPGTPQYREAMTGHVNPSQFMEFGSDATGRQLIQTRGMMGGGDPASGAPGALAPGGGSVVQRYNNPGAIRPDGQSQWQGMTGVSPEGFVIFDTPENGRRAGIINVQNQARLHGIGTLNDLFTKYAPASDGNDPAAYAARVAQAVGVRPDQPINLADPQIAARVFDAGIVPVEGGGTPSPQRQRGPRVIASTPPVSDRDAPSGYRWSSDGRTLEAIPGGPGDARFGNNNRKGEADLRKEFDALPEVKTFKTARTAYNQLLAIAGRKNASPQDDLAAIFTFMRSLDPTSTVREGEFATAQNATGVPDAIRNAYNRVQTGNRLNRQQRIEMVNTAGRAYTQQREAYNAAANQYRGYAADYGVNPDRVARTYRRIGKPTNVAKPALPPGWTIERVK